MAAKKQTSSKKKAVAKKRQAARRPAPTDAELKAERDARTEQAVRASEQRQGRSAPPLPAVEPTGRFNTEYRLTDDATGQEIPFRMPGPDEVIVWDGGRHIIMSLDVLRDTVQPKKGEHYSQTEGGLAELVVLIQPQDLKLLQVVAAWRNSDVSNAVTFLIRGWANTQDGQDITAQGATLTKQQLDQALG